MLYSITNKKIGGNNMLNMNDFAEYLVNVVEIDNISPLEIEVVNLVTDQPVLAKKILEDEPLNETEELILSELLMAYWKIHNLEVMDIMDFMLSENILKPIPFADPEYYTLIAIDFILTGFYARYKEDLEHKLENKTY